jgi:uncharacterized membrane protein/predicted membrane protein
MQTSASERMATAPAIAVSESTEVAAPVSEVYRRWTDFSRFPEFMESVQEVRPLGGGRYHWVARLLGAKQEWDSEVIDQQENHHITWRNINGPPSRGTVTLLPLPNNRTRVDLLMEYTPPGGVVGQRLDKLTGASQREVKKALTNFRRLVSGERMAMEEVPGFTNVLSAMAIPAAAGAIGATVSYLVERNRLTSRAKLPLMGRMGFANPVEKSAGAAGTALTTAAIGTLITSVIFRARRDHLNGLTIGQWVPTLLAGSILARLVGHRGVNPTLPASVTSWAFTGAAAGSLISSLIAHFRSTRHEGLFIGEWAPSLLAGAIFARLFNRW